MRRGVPAAAVATLMAVLPRVASAQDSHRRVALDLEDCLGADAAGVRRILAAELGDVLAADIELTAVRQGEAGHNPNLTLASADCGVESAIVVVSHAAAALRLERRVDLANAPPNARTRLLALSVAELVASTWATVDAQPPEDPPASDPPRAEPAPPPPPPPPRARRVRPRPPPVPPRPPTRPVGIRAVAVARVSGSPAHLSGGGGLGLEVGLPFSLGVGADFRYEQGDADVGALGDVRLRVAWGTLAALVRPLVDWSSVSVGLGLKLGVAWLEGLPAEGISGRTHSGLVAGPAIVAHVALHVGGSGYLHVGLELSWISVGVAGLNGATHETVASFGGPQIALTAGFEIQPSR